MGWKETAEPILTRMPVVARPEGHVPFKRKLAWTGGILVLYFFLTTVDLFGLPEAGASGDFYGQFRSILAGQQGSILQLGIGPIVTASIVLQLLGGANLLGLDTDDPRDQVLYQGLQKLLVVVMIFLTGVPMVFAGNFLPPSQQLAQTLGVDTFTVRTLIFAQIAVGGLLILFMDEVISKWGVGSGIGLFIVAGVSRTLVGGLFGTQAISNNNGFFPTWVGIATGAVDIQGVTALLLDQGQLIALFTTVLIFSTVVYAESTRVEIPLSHARVKGARGRFPVKLIYASVLPIILVRALTANIQFLGRILNSQLGSGMPAWLGVYSQGQPVAGLFYFLRPVRGPEQWMWFVYAPQGTPTEIMLRVGLDLFITIVGSAIFAIFWVETTYMGPYSSAHHIMNSGMQIPGFRQNPQVIERVMERYIPQVTVIGGALVGLLAVLANLLPTLGGVTGTGLLLTVSITYKLYEEIAEEQLMEMHPMMREMFGNS